MDDDTSDKILRMKLSDQVLMRLKAMIASGELGAGDKVPSERSLMDRFGVGRPAVREALQALHTQGVITINHGERSRVNAISPETVLTQSDAVARLLLDAAPANLEHLKDARRMFEIGLVREAALRADAGDVALLRQRVADQRACLSAGADQRGFIRADMAFHTAIAEIQRNPVLTAVSSAMLGWLLEYHAALLHWSGKEHVTLAEHDRIVDAIDARDPEAAAEAMRVHLDRSAALYAPRA